MIRLTTLLVFISLYSLNSQASTRYLCGFAAVPVNSPMSPAPRMVTASGDPTVSRKVLGTAGSATFVLEYKTSGPGEPVDAVELRLEYGGVATSDISVLSMPRRRFPADLFVILRTQSETLSASCMRCPDVTDRSGREERFEGDMCDEADQL